MEAVGVKGRSASTGPSSKEEGEGEVGAGEVGAGEAGGLVRAVGGESMEAEALKEAGGWPVRKVQGR